MPAPRSRAPWAPPACGAVDRVVIGVPGAVDPRTERLGYASHLPGWHIPDLLSRLREGLGVPVAVENDVNLVAMAELAHGQVAESRDFVLLWVSAGIGLAIVLGGTLVRGATGGAGEVGYMPVASAPIIREPGRANTGGLQAVAGAPAVIRLLREHGFRGEPRRPDPPARPPRVRARRGTGGGGARRAGHPARHRPRRDRQRARPGAHRPRR